jgi:phytoene dehydrogenase-like protein
LIKPLLEDWPGLAPDVLGPLQFPSHPIALAKFGLNALTSAEFLSKRFSTKEAKGLWAGMAAHSIQPLSNIASSAIGLVLLATGHLRGWPVSKGGSQSIANALAAYFLSLGGKIQTNFNIQHFDQLPTSDAVLFDVTAKQLLQIAGQKLSSIYKWQLNRYRYGMGVFKIDWALDEPIPFTAQACRQSGTIHLGNTFNEIASSELQTSKGKVAEKPFVLLAQQSLFDASRAPEGKHTAWAYCHVPNGSQVDMTETIEKQVERFAPGFRERILAKHTMNTYEMQVYNANYIGGDINGGVIDISQLYTGRL